MEMLFDPHESDLETTCGCFNLHKKTVIDQLLCDKEVRQLLDPVDYIRMHCDYRDKGSTDSVRSGPPDNLCD